MWPSLEAIWLTPVSEVTKWYPLPFLPSLILFLHLSFLCVWAASVTQWSFSPAPETEFTPRQLELNSSKSWALAVVENNVFYQAPTGPGGAPGSSGSSRHFSMGSSWWSELKVQLCQVRKRRKVGVTTADRKGLHSPPSARSPDPLKAWQIETQKLGIFTLLQTTEKQVQNHLSSFSLNEAIRKKIPWESFQHLILNVVICFRFVRVGLLSETLFLLAITLNIIATCHQNKSALYQENNWLLLTLLYAAVLREYPALVPMFTKTWS